MGPARKKLAVGSGSKPSSRASSPLPVSPGQGSLPPHSEAYAPIVAPTSEERESWPGFVERESEPAFFNVLLQDLGVKDVRLQEVWQLDAEVLQRLPQPVYGILFLSRWRQRDTRLPKGPARPRDVWFANQISENACSTISLLNILNNAPIELGPELAQFKQATKDLRPFDRGNAIDNSDHIRKCHNSLARRIQMMIDDVAQQESFDEGHKVAKPVASKKRKRGNDDDEDEGDKKDDEEDSKATDSEYDTEAANHYRAFVPVNNEVWMLDGMERKPQKVGTYSDSRHWYHCLEAWFEAEMLRMKGDAACNIMAITRDEVCAKREDLAGNIKALQQTEKALVDEDPEWSKRIERSSSEEADDKEAVRDACTTHGVSRAMIDAANTSEAIESKDLIKLKAAQKDLVDQNSRLRSCVLEGQQAAVAERKSTEERKYDYLPFITTFLGRLAEKEGVMKKLLDQL